MMILTKYINYRGKKKKVSDLSITNSYKVDVQCPECKEIRNVYHRSIINAGHCICVRCIRKIKQRKLLNIQDKYGNLTIKAHSEKSGFSVCECICGTIKEVDNWQLITGRTKSCGCLRLENKFHFEVKCGENHWNWQGGKSSERERFMQTTEYKNWRTEVFKRDNYTCQCCGQEGYKLNAHHIKSYSENPELRTDVDNGITLCQNCHKKFHHIYGIKNIGIEEIKKHNKQLKSQKEWQEVIELLNKSNSEEDGNYESTINNKA